MSTDKHPSEICEIVTSVARLTEVADILSRQKEIAMDLEMDSLHHYREKVCLIQISTRFQTWLIDPLALDDLSPLAGPLSDPDILVVMHGADYDIRSLHRDFGIEVKKLFDTMIAARFLGILEFGLAALLRVRFGIELDKKYQKADWSKRPLSPEMSKYAAADTSDLLPLYDQFKMELLQNGRLTWVEEECLLICQARVTEKEGPLFLYCKGAGKLKGRTLAILEELLQLRDRQAQALDRPPFKVLSAETLQEIAEISPRTMIDLSRVKGMTPGQLNRHGAAILQAVALGMEMPEGKLPRFPHSQKNDMVQGSKERLKKLKRWREQRSAELGLESGLFAPNWLLEAAADFHPLTWSGLESITGIRQWQKNLCADDIIKAAAAETTGEE